MRLKIYFIMFFILAFSASAYAPFPDSDYLDSYYRIAFHFNQSSGENATDSISGLYGSPVIATTITGAWLDGMGNAFNNSAQTVMGYHIVNNDSTPAFTNNVTVCAWINYSGGQQYYMHTDNIYIGANGGDLVLYDTAFRYCGGSAGKNFESALHHVCWSWNGSYAYCYVNGTQFGNATPVIKTWSGEDINYVGMASGANYWDGWLDDLIVIGKFMTASEVNEIYAGDFVDVVGNMTDCNQVWTTDVSLNNTIYCQSGESGIIIGANDLTIDCHGHSIISNVTSASVNGITSSGFTGTTIKNCNIQNFNHQLYLASNSFYTELLNSTLIGNLSTSGLAGGEVYLATGNYFNMTDTKVYSNNSNCISSGASYYITIYNSNLTSRKTNAIYAFTSAYFNITNSKIYSQNASAIYGLVSVNNINLNNVSIKTNNKGIELPAGTNSPTAKIINSNIDAGTYGIYLTTVKNYNITNSTISGGTSDLYYVNSGTSTNNNYINDVLNHNTITSASTNFVLNFFDYGRFNITDTASNGLSASVLFSDANTSSKSYSRITSADGTTDYEIYKIYSFKNGVATPMNNYTINVSKLGYYGYSGLKWNISELDVFHVSLTSIEAPSVNSTTPLDNESNNSKIIEFRYEAYSNVTIENCSLYTNESGWDIAETNYSDYGIVTHTFLTDKTYLWAIGCYDNQSNISFSENRTLIIDTIYPECYSFGNASVYNNTYFEWNVTCYDNHFYSLNISCISSYENFSFYEDGLDTTEYYFSNRTLLYDEMYCDIEYCDGHTASLIEQMEIGNLSSKSERTFDNSIRLVYEGEFKDFVTDYKRDRISFDVMTDAPRTQDKFIIYSDSYIYIMNSSAYLGWIVTGKYWVDFESDNVRAVSVKRLSSNVVEITTDFYKPQTSMLYTSIGKLNCVTASQSVTIEGKPIFRTEYCVLNEELSFILGYFFIFIFLFLILWFNETNLKFPFLTLLDGIGFIVLSLPLYACSNMIAIPITVFGLALWVIELRRAGMSR